MEVIKRVSQMREFIRDRKARGRTIGFVPTMGYLHAGHLSLVRRAFRDCDEVVVSIFVNPTQFGPREDFGRYPRDIERDKRMLAACGVRVVFCPLPREMYPEGCGTYVDVPRLSRGLCGGLRPGHFQGVATVVAKLFNIISPDIAYFGQKDFQQACVIRRMVKDLNMPLRIKALPTVREPDGLAMSSRNSYLSRQQRSQAVVLCQSLKQAKGLIKNGEKSAAKIIRFIRGRIGRMSQARIDYVSVVNAQTLGSIKQIEKNTLIALAVYFGDTRLIDNVIITRDGHCVCPR
ncbi:MAG: pantoate--beta-alanine ligase [Candidatus Omnitrophota bacterium]